MRSAITRALDFVYAMTWPVRFRINDDQASGEGITFEDDKAEIWVYWDPEGGEDIILSIYKKTPGGSSIWLGNITVGFRSVNGKGEDVLVTIRTRKSTRRAIEALLDTGEVLR